MKMRRWSWSAETTGAWFDFATILFCTCVLLLGASSIAVAQATDCDVEEDTGRRLKCKQNRLLDEQDRLVGNMAIFEGVGGISSDDIDRLSRANQRARKAASRTDSKHFKTLSKKNRQICDFVEHPDWGDGDFICEPGEKCLEVIGDSVGNDDGICKLKGNNKEVCEEICGDGTGDQEELAEETDEEAQADWEAAYDDLTGQLAQANDTLEQISSGPSPLATRSITGPCDVATDWDYYKDLLSGLAFAKGFGTSSRGAADIAERACDQTGFGFNSSAACIVLETVALVGAVALDLVVISIDEQGQQIMEATEECLRELSNDLETANFAIATVGASAGGAAANSAILVGDPTCDVSQAARQLSSADELIAEGQYLKGCQRLAMAMQALTK